MNQFQKVVKYVAMAFAVFLTVFIIGSIASAAGIMVKIFGFGENIISKKNDKGGAIVQEDGIIESFDNIDKVHIIHVVTLPKDMKLEDLHIAAGAGDLLIEDFTVNELTLDAGAGSVKINNVEAHEVDINGGAGEIILSDVVFSDSDISCGVGLVKFDGKLLNDNDISAGVGELNLKIRGKQEDYDIKIEKGLGEIRIDGQKYKEVDIRHNNSKHSLDIEGGVGRINVKFVD